MNKKLLLGAVVAGTGFAIVHSLFAKTARPKASVKRNSYQAVNAYIEAQMRRLRIPGAALVIVEGKRMVHFQGFGLARPGGEAPTLRTPFFIGSLTKSITALAVMQLVEAGRVELDAPVQRYLPWFRVADPGASEKMKVRHLLNQTSGLSFFASQVSLANLDNLPGAAERQVRAMSTMRLNHPVGEQVEYCNLNYNVLGLIIETASGEAYGDYVQKYIFEPLKMKHSYITKETALQNGMAMGYRHWFGFPIPAPNLPIPLGSLASGQLISCAQDMAHYMIAHLNGGRYGDIQIVSSEGAEELHRGELEYLTLGISAGSYAMGWFDQKIDQVRILTHGGNVPEFSAFMALVPEQKKGIVLLLNADPYGLPMITDEIGKNTAAVLIGQQPEPIRLDFIQWVFRLLPLIPILQLAGVITTMRKVDIWTREPKKRPGGGKLWIGQILLPLLPNLSLAALLAYLQSSGLLGFIRLYMPDLAWIARISGGFGVIWAFLRTRLILNALRKTDL